MMTNKVRTALRQLLSARQIQRQGIDRTYIEPTEVATNSILLNAEEKKSFGDFTEDQLLNMPVRIGYFSDEMRERGSILEYETDMDRFLNTLLFCKLRKEDNPAISEEYLDELTDLIVKDEPFDEYMYTVGMHYLVCWPEVEYKLRFGLQPLSFTVFLSSNSQIQPFVQMSSPDEWLIVRDFLFENYLNQKK